MNDDRNATMAEALRLTRRGQLMEATALLQQGLGGIGLLCAADRRPTSAGAASSSTPRTTSRTARQLTPWSGLAWPGQVAPLPQRRRQARPAARSVT